MLCPRPLLPALALLLGACPQRVDPVKKEPPKVAVSADDPRVVADTDDLYPASAEEAAGPAPGAGIPDETNGVCRLFAPRLPSPECCDQDLGFSAEVAKRACGHDLYLGESFHLTCGYYFADDEAVHSPKWLRLSWTLESTVKEAVKAHDELISLRVVRDPSFHSEPVPGAPGAFWSRHEHLRWAILPGWTKPRLLSWRDTSCSDEGIQEVIRALIAAPEIPAGTPRRHRIPGGTPETREAEAAAEEAAG